MRLIKKIHMWRISIVFFCCIFSFFILWIFKTWYLFAIYQFNHMYHILLSISYLLSYYFWKSINKWRNGGDLKLGLPHFLNYGPLNIFVNISNRRHFNIYWWIFKSSGSKESSCGVEYDTYENKYIIWRISIILKIFFKFEY